ncbi:MAG TPA: phenylalanine--tRNA ligase beta subunit-related protein [Thermoanaerobaculia bacterium]|nr:phenylalanine--tRNA ligase beta subunit-related protein [Thermoanaerobaculia bacterium]
MRLTIAEAVVSRFPGTVLGVAVARGIDNSGPDSEVTALLREAQTGIPARFAGRPVAEHPNFAVWREAYRSFGAKPKEHRSSIESLVRRVLKGEAIPHVNRLVDIYNAVSLQTLLPAGAEDLDAMEGDLELTIASGEEPPVRLLGEPEARPPRAGEVIYRDRAGVVCRRWNWKEADRTKLTERTRNAVAVVEGLPPIEPSAVAAAIEAIALWTRTRCGGAVTTAILGRLRPSVDL